MDSKYHVVCAPTRLTLTSTTGPRGSEWRRGVFSFTSRLFRFRWSRQSEDSNHLLRNKKVSPTPSPVSAKTSKWTRTSPTRLRRFSRLAILAVAFLLALFAVIDLTRLALTDGPDEEGFFSSRATSRWSPQFRSRCSKRCSRHGTCNEELGRCDCPPGFTGDACEADAFPSCELAPGFRTPCAFPSTCACARECRAFHLIGPGAVCFNASLNVSAIPPRSLADIFRAEVMIVGAAEGGDEAEWSNPGMAEGEAQSGAGNGAVSSAIVSGGASSGPRGPSIFHSNDLHALRKSSRRWDGARNARWRGVGARDVPSGGARNDWGSAADVGAAGLGGRAQAARGGMAGGAQQQMWARYTWQLRKRYTDPRECPLGCSGRGLCRDASKTCDCAWRYAGPGCEEERAGGVRCVNECSGRGRCDGGTCVCQAGSFGIDCSLSLDPSTGNISILPNPTFRWPPQSLLFRAALQDKNPRPRVYVYELPPELNTWQWEQSGALDRPEGVVFLERLLADGRRTADGEQADYFYVPLVTR
ncbi:unnamed protein product [Closterium sp. NIES-54]